MAMPESDTKMTPLEYMRRADKELAAGNDREAAGLLWKATKATIIELAQARGLECNNLDNSDFIDLAQALEGDESTPGHYYRGKIAAGSLLNAHAEMDALEDYELESAYKVARKFIVQYHGESE